MTFKEISDHLLAGKMVGNKDIGWMLIDIRGDLVGYRENSDLESEDHLVGYLFCSCDNLEVRE